MSDGAAEEQLLTPSAFQRRRELVEIETRAATALMVLLFQERLADTEALRLASTDSSIIKTSCVLSTLLLAWYQLLTT